MPQMNVFFEGFLKELTLSEDEFWLNKIQVLLSRFVKNTSKHIGKT